MATETELQQKTETTEATSEAPQAPSINEDAVIGMTLAKQYMKAIKHGQTAANVVTKAAHDFEERHPKSVKAVKDAVTSVPGLALDTVGYAYTGAIATIDFTARKAVPFTIKNTAKYGLLYPAKYGIVLPAVMFDDAFPKTSKIIQSAPVTAFNTVTSGMATAFDTVIAAPYLFVKDDVITPALDRAVVQPVKQFAKDNPKVFSVFKRDPSAQPGPFKKRLNTSAKALWDVLPFEAPSEKYPKTYAAAQKGAQGVKSVVGTVFGAGASVVKFGFNEAVVPAAKFTGQNIISPSVKFAVNDVISPIIDNTVIKPAKLFDRTFPEVSSKLQAGFKEVKGRSGSIATNTLAGAVAGSILTVRAAFGIFDIALDWAWKRPSKAFTKWKPETAQATKNVYDAYQGVFKKVPYPATLLLIPALGGPALYSTYWGTMGTKALLAAQMAGESVAAPGLKMAAYTFVPKLSKIVLFKPVMSMGKTTKYGFFGSDLYNQHLKVGYEKYIDPGIQKSMKMVDDVDEWIEETIPSYKQIKVMLKPNEDGIKARAKKWANDVKPSIVGAFSHASETLRVRPKPEASVNETVQETKAESVTTTPSALDDKTARAEWKVVTVATTDSLVGVRVPANDAAAEEKDDAPQNNGNASPV